MALKIPPWVGAGSLRMQAADGGREAFATCEKQRVGEHADTPRRHPKAAVVEAENGSKPL